MANDREKYEAIWVLRIRRDALYAGAKRCAIRGNSRPLLSKKLLAN